MKFSNITLSALVIITALTLSGCEEESNHPTNLTKFLPSGSNATRYSYKTTSSHKSLESGVIKGKNQYAEKVITSRDDNCVFMDHYTLLDEEDLSHIPDNAKKYIVDGKMKGITEQLCADEDKIYYHSSPILYDKRGDWTMELHNVLASGEEKIIESKCHFVSLSKENILEKTREVIHTQCTYEIERDVVNSDDWFIAEGVGLYKIVMTMDAKDTNSHSVITMTLGQIE